MRSAQWAMLFPTVRGTSTATNRSLPNFGRSGKNWEGSYRAVRNFHLTNWHWALSDSKVNETLGASTMIISYFDPRVWVLLAIFSFPGPIWVIQQQSSEEAVK